MQSGIGFIPYSGYVVVVVPSSVYESSIELHETVKKSKREEYVKSGEPLIVAAVGNGVTFVSLGDEVMVAGRASIQQIELSSGEDGTYYIIREIDILGKLDGE